MMGDYKQSKHELKKATKQISALKLELNQIEMMNEDFMMQFGNKENKIAKQEKYINM